MNFNWKCFVEFSIKMLLIPFIRNGDFYVVNVKALCIGQALIWILFHGNYSFVDKLKSGFDVGFWAQTRYNSAESPCVIWMPFLFRVLVIAHIWLHKMMKKGVSTQKIWNEKLSASEPIAQYIHQFLWKTSGKSHFHREMMLNSCSLCCIDAHAPNISWTMYKMMNPEWNVQRLFVEINSVHENHC